MDYAKYIELKEKGKIVLEPTGEGMDSNALINVDSEELVMRTDRVSLRRLINQRDEFAKQVDVLQRMIKGIDALMEDIKPLTTSPELEPTENEPDDE